MAGTCSAKRARTEGRDYSTYAKDPGYYFSDGTICLAVEDTLFRLHRGLLTRHSTVFSDMLSLPPDTGNSDAYYEGVPIAALVDKVKDIKVLFKLMFDAP